MQANLRETFSPQQKQTHVVCGDPELESFVSDRRTRQLCSKHGDKTERTRYVM